MSAGRIRTICSRSGPRLHRSDAALSAGGLSVVRATATQLRDEPVAVVVRMAQTLARAA